MRFAILGDHPDGWRLARALRDSGRHEVTIYAGPTLRENLSDDWPRLQVTTDIEEPLADPAIDAAIVAGPLPVRLDQLRRVLQSERPAFCVHPVDPKPDGGFEINMLLGDLHQVVLPIMPEAYSPRLPELRTQFESSTAMLDGKIDSTGEFIDASIAARPAFPGWTVLRRIGGDVAEVAAFAASERLEPGQPVSATGAFLSGRLFRVMWSPRQESDSIEFTFRADGQPAETIALEETSADWSALIARFEELVARLSATPRAAPGSGPALAVDGGLSWLDEIRALELNEAARHGIKRRRSYVLDYQEANEDVGFKGTMTLVGCALIWLVPVLLVLSAWVPQIGWAIVPILLVFLGLQALKWLVAEKRTTETHRTQG